MQIRKTLVAMLAVAVAVAFSPITETQAASPFGSGSLGTESLTYTVKAKGKTKAKRSTKAKRKARRGKTRSKRTRRAASKAGRCGTGMYWSKSKRSCQAAATK